MVRFIVGKADLNISAAMRGEMIAQLEKEQSAQKIVFIVPDQFEYETEKSVYRILEAKGLLKRFYEINITTFSRLCREILEADGEHRPFADDIVKNIIMHKTLSQNKSSLSALNKVASYRGFCGKMVKTVSALKTSGITARDLELSLNAITQTDKSLSAEQPIIKKLYETNLLYTNYESLLSAYVDKLDITAMAANVIAKNDCGAFKGANVLVDCFNDFTASQLQFLKNAMLKAKNITFGFTSLRHSDRDVFKTPNGHISRLKREAEENDLSVEFVTEGIESRFSEDAPLRGISKYLFQSVKSGEDLKDTCELVRARSVYEELDYAAAKIKELTVDKGMRYGEIAVLCTDAGAYGKYVESVFKKYEIPIFLDMPEPILYQPLINLVVSILNALKDFSADTVLSCVKTKFFAKPKLDGDGSENFGEEEYPDEFSDGEKDENGEASEAGGNEQLTLFDVFGEAEAAPGGAKISAPKRQFITLSDKDIDEFENYVYEWDLKTSQLKKPFKFKDKHAGSDLSQQTAEIVRKAVAEPLLELQKRLLKSGKAINGAELTEQLYDFLINEVGMRRAIYKRCKNEQNTALDAAKVALYQRLWNSLADILGKLHEQLSDTNVTIAEYTDIFREICAATTLATPPQVIDSVLVGDIDRTRADNIKAAFIVGASYEAFPTPASEAGIFSQYELELICDKIVHIENADSTDVSAYAEILSHIGDTDRSAYCLKSAKEQYYLSLYRAYRAVTLPTEYLCVSCPDRDIDGEGLAFSDVFAEISATFDDVKIINAEDMGNEFYCRTLNAAKMRYAMRLNDAPKENAVLREVLKNEDGGFVKALDEIRDMRSDAAYRKDGEYFSGKHSLTPKTARLLFPKSMGTTSVEKLNLCKFNYFCEYGLKIDERRRRTFTVSKRGEAIHFIFQNVLREYSGDMPAFFALKRSELLSLSKKHLEVYRKDETNSDSSEDKRTEYLFNNIANSAADVLITVQTELFARRYRPKFFELNIKTDPSEPENNIHALIDNEQAPESSPPEAEIFSESEAAPTAPSAPKFDENAPYLITAPLEIALENGDKITVQGIIDRVDMFRAEEVNGGKPTAYIRVVDYKSAVHSFDIKNAQNGVNIQMLLYLFALQSANENNPTLELRPGGVTYIPSRNKGASDEQLSPYRLLAMNYHESGLFIKDEITEKDLNNYKETVFEKLNGDSSVNEKELEKIKGSFEPNEQNLAEAKFFGKLREDVLKKVSENLGAIFGGTIDALPINYYEFSTSPDGGEKTKLKDPCEYCRFGEICQNAGKNAIKIEKSKSKKSKDGGEQWQNTYITPKEPEPEPEKPKSRKRKSKNDTESEVNRNDG